MKKLLCLFVALLVCGALTLLVSNAEAATVPTTCQACGQEVTWTELPATVPTEAGHYHYYLTKTVSQSQWSVKADTTICIDLNGFGIETTGRSMIISTGSVVNLMDSSAAKTGYLQGRRGSNNTVGGTISIQKDASFNLYSGTVRCIMDDDGQLLYRAGVIYNQTGATMNMYGGVVEGGEVLDDGKNTPRGATIANNGTLNLYGGEIRMGKLPEGKGYAPCVESANGTVKLTGNAKVADLYGPAGFLTVDGTFSGNAYVTLSDGVSNGKDIGSAKNTPKVTGNLFCNNGNGWLINVSGSDLKLATFTPSATCHYCEHCKNVVNWTALTSDNVGTLNTAGEYHMYLAAARKSWAQAKIANGTKVCIDLYGKQWKAADQRVIYLYENAQVNLMDSVGGGEMVGTTAKNNPTGGLTVLKAGAEFNMYGGTLRVETKYLEGYGIGVGGIAYMNENGTFNLYGGTIQGIDLVLSEYKLNTNGVGAAFYMASSAQLNVFGGHIKNGTLGEKCIAPCVYLKSNTAKVTMSGDGQVDDIYCTSENDQVTISGTFTGTVNLSYAASIKLAESQVVGKAVNANISDATATCGEEWMLAVSGNNLVLTPNATAVLYGEDNTIQTFESLQAAVDAFESGYVKLMRPTAENVSVSKNLLLDLSGKSITGTVTVAEGCTLYIKDNQTDDYSIANGICGKLAATENVKAAEGYLLVNEEGQLSAHKYEVAITAMTLRADAAGIYYKSAFLGDEKVAAAVESFGVALSVIDEPYEKNISTKCVASEFTGFESGENGNAGTSTLLKGILKDTNTDAINSRNMAMTIYGRPYIKTADGYLFGETISRSLNKQLTDIDGMVDELSGGQLHHLKEFYKKYESQLSGLNLENVAREAHDTTVKILGIGNSYTHDSMWMLGAIYKAEKNQDVILGIAYEGGCPLDDHVKFYNNNEPCYNFNYYDPKVGKWVTTQNVTLQEIIVATDWDLVSMQQSSGKSGVETSYNSDIDTIQGFVKNDLGYTPTFFWNMTWSYPGVDIPGDGYTVDDAPNNYAYKNYYNSDEKYMYQMITQTVQNKIIPNDTFNWIMPTGTAVQNAKESKLTPEDLYRDYTHLNDYGRLLAGYVWYSTMEGVPADTFKLNYIPDALTKTYTQAGDIYLDAEMFAILEESVRNAIANPYAVTPSQYPES